MSRSVTVTSTTQHVEVNPATGTVSVERGGPQGPPGVDGGSITQEDLDAKVDLAGDTMTGPLVLAADPTVALEAATKQYVDANAGGGGGSGSLDGGTPSSIYGGTTPIDGGAP